MNDSQILEHLAATDAYASHVPLPSTVNMPFFSGEYAEGEPPPYDVATILEGLLEGGGTRSIEVGPPTEDAGGSDYDASIGRRWTGINED